MPYVYIMTNKYNNVLYVGVTNNLERRVAEHRAGIVESFTKRYNLKKLVYFECFEHMNDAIAREKSLKGKKREKKIALIENGNPQWNDLYDEFTGG